VLVLLVFCGCGSSASGVVFLLLLLLLLLVFVLQQFIDGCCRRDFSIYHPLHRPLKGAIGLGLHKAFCESMLKEPLHLTLDSGLVPRSSPAGLLQMLHVLLNLRR